MSNKRGRITVNGARLLVTWLNVYKLMKSLAESKNARCCSTSTWRRPGPTPDGLRRRHGWGSSPWPPWPLTPDTIWASASLRQPLFRIPAALIRRWPRSRCCLSTFHSFHFRRRPPLTAGGGGERGRGHRTALRKHLVWPQRKTSCSQRSHKHQQIVSTDRNPSVISKIKTHLHKRRRGKIQQTQCAHGPERATAFIYCFGLKITESIHMQFIIIIIQSILHCMIICIIVLYNVNMFMAHSMLKCYQSVTLGPICANNK